MTAKDYKNLRVSNQEYQLVKHKQIELISKRGKTLSLTEVVDEIVRKGINLVE